MQSQTQIPWLNHSETQLKSVLKNDTKSMLKSSMQNVRKIDTENVLKTFWTRRGNATFVSLISLCNNTRGSAELLLTICAQYIYQHYIHAMYLKVHLGKTQLSMVRELYELNKV